MKKHLSVLFLIARESIYRICFVIAALSAVQAVLFNFSLKAASENALPSITDVFDSSWISIVFYLSVIVISVLLCKTGMQFNSVPGYTLKRLRISETAVFLWQCVYNFLVFLIAVLTEAVLCFYLAKFAADRLPEEYITNQSVYLAMYKNMFIQNLFAGRDVFRAIRNITVMLSFSVNCAAFSLLFRRGKKWFGAVLMLAVFIGMLCYSDAEMSNLVFDTAIFYAAVILMVATVIYVTGGGKYYEE